VILTLGSLIISSVETENFFYFDVTLGVGGISGVNVVAISV